MIDFSDIKISTSWPDRLLEHQINEDLFPMFASPQVCGMAEYILSRKGAIAAFNRRVITSGEDWDLHPADRGRYAGSQWGYLHEYYYMFTEGRTLCVPNFRYSEMDSREIKLTPNLNEVTCEKCISTYTLLVLQSLE